MKDRELKLMDEVYAVVRENRELGCSDIVVNFGYNGITINECPPMFIESLMKRGFAISISNGNVHIDKYSL